MRIFSRRSQDTQGDGEGGGIPEDYYGVGGTAGITQTPG